MNQPIERENPEISQSPSATNTERAFVTREQFQAQAEDIFSTIEKHAKENRLREGYAEANQAYVVEEETPQLRDLAEVLLTAPVAMRAQEKLDQEGAPSNQPGKELLIAFNHKLRGLISANINTLAREDLEQWLEKATNGDQVWSKQVLNGVSAEVAIYHELLQMNEHNGVRYSTLEEEQKGGDIIVATDSGEQVMLDVKHGLTASRKDSHFKYETKEITLEKEDIDGFRIARSSKENIRKLLNYIIQ